MAHGDAREGKWRGNWRMEWIASTLHTTSKHVVSSINTADAHTWAASSRLNWRPRRFKWTRPFRRKIKCSFGACAITFQLASNTRNNARCQNSYDHDMNIRRQNKYALYLPGMEFIHHVLCHLSFRVINTQWTASMKSNVSLSRCWRNSFL